MARRERIAEAMKDVDLLNDEIDIARLGELAVRLVAPGPKAGHISASEIHEIADGIADLINDLATLSEKLNYLRAENEKMKRERELHLVLITQDAKARDTIRTGWVNEEREWRAEHARLRELLEEACKRLDDDTCERHYWAKHIREAFLGGK